MKKMAVLFFVFFNSFVYAQQDRIEHCLLKLHDESKQQILRRREVEKYIQQHDSVSQLQLLDKLKLAVQGHRQVIQARFLAIQSRVLFYLPSGTFQEDTNQIYLMKRALDLARKLDEPYMVAEYSRYYGEMLLNQNKKSEAIQYCLNAATIMNDLGEQYFHSVKAFYLSLGDIFFQVKQYRSAITYFSKGLQYPNQPDLDSTIVAMSLNNLGIAYRNLGKFDSSLLVLNRCMQYSDSMHISSWYAFAHDNRFDAFLELQRFDSCKKIADIAYADGMTDTAELILAGAYWQYGRIKLRQHHYKEALFDLLKSYAFKEKVPKVNFYDTRLYQDLFTTYETLNDGKNAFLFYKKYMSAKAIEDAENKILSENYLFAKASFEKENLKWLKWKHERSRAIQIRNISILIILMLSFGLLFNLNRKRMRAQQVSREAKHALSQFMQQVLDKDIAYDRLQTKLIELSESQTTVQQIEMLSQQIILTEDDWLNFQKLFDQAYNGYIFRLRTKIPTITAAECRLSLLIKMKLSNKQIAAMQGIGVDAVHKTKQRLRNKLGMESSQELEQLLERI